MPNIILTGFSYTGKSEVASLLAQRLGWQALDTDAWVVKKAGKPIHRIFAEEGEEHFRELERQVLEQACAAENVVVSTGGGAVLRPESRALMMRSGFVVCLEAAPETIAGRLREQAERGAAGSRPLLQGDDVLGMVTRLKEQRQPFYACAHWTVHTDRLSMEQVADEVLRAYRMRDQQGEGTSRGGLAFPDAAYVVSTLTTTYPGYVGWGILDGLGRRMREVGLGGAAYVIADRPVFSAYGKQVIASLKGAGFSVDHFFLTPGEATKSLATAERIYTWLAQRRAERGHVVLALGGGMAGDLAGFVAATYLRGMPFVQAPTTLLAMVDASIGGKVAVNLPAGKNLVGAFYQPRLVLADVATLKTLPPRELTAGWAEVIKHGLILDRGLFERIQGDAARLTALDPEATAEVIQRAAAIKARVVGADERESGDGPRTLLNYGHTLGHALEAAAGYQGLLHGEAVAIGMTAAAEIARRMGLLSAGAARRQRQALAAFALPLKAPPVNVEAVRQAMALDKKVAGAVNRWVLLEEIGRATVRSDVPPQVVEAALQSAIAS